MPKLANSNKINFKKFMKFFDKYMLLKLVVFIFNIFLIIHPNFFLSSLLNFKKLTSVIYDNKYVFLSITFILIKQDNFVDESKSKKKKLI